MSLEETQVNGVPVLIVTETSLDDREWGRKLRLTPFEPGRPWSLQVLDEEGQVIGGLIVSADDINAVAAAVRNEELTQRAARMGAEQGRIDAAWVFDGNTPDDRYRTVLSWIDAGDPLKDQLEAGLDGISEADLAAELDIEDWEEDAPVSELLEAWEHAQADAFWAEVEKTAREHLAGMQGKAEDR